MLSLITCTAILTLYGLGALLPSQQPANKQAFVLASSFGRRGHGHGAFGTPYGPTGVTVSRNGEIVIADCSNHCIQNFSSSGNYLRQFGKFGHAQGRFNHPTAVACSPSGNIIVADTGNHRVQIFDAKGTYLSQFGRKGKGKGEFSGVMMGVCCLNSDTIVVTDSANAHIQTFNRKPSP